MNEKKTESIKFSAKAVIFEDRLGEFKIIKGTAYDEHGINRLCNCSIKGQMPDVEEGDQLFAMGHWEDHPKFGRSLIVVAYIKCIPNTKKSILNYLEKGNIAGITKARAQVIVDKFGENTFDILLHSPEYLEQIKGIGQKSIEKISKSARENLETQAVLSAIMINIQNFGISPAYAKRIYDQYGSSSMQVIRENPYRLAEDVKGIGFLKADEIAKKNGVREDSPYRIESAVLFVLKQMRNEGDVFGRKDQVVKQCRELLMIDQECITTAIERLLDCQKLKSRDDDLYLPYLYYAEMNAAKNLVRIACAKKNGFAVSDDDIVKLKETLGLLYDYNYEQVNAIKAACQSNMIVITGGPGTGKTTITNGIIRLCKNRMLSVACAAPTGKAAKRLSESTRIKALTIHKLLDPYYDEEKGKLVFKNDELCQLKMDVLIIDECSMIDISLFDSLLKAVKSGTKLILVGDVDQLPSVGCGNVLHDVIVSGAVSVEKLKTICRQAENSKISQNAHLINEGKMPSLINKKDGDFFFVNVQNMKPEEIRDKIVDYACENLPKYYNVDPDEVQILAPMKKGHTGVYELNNFIQDKRHQSKNNKFLMNAGTVFYEGDKVMCTVNDYEMLVFNGDIGKIVEIKTEINDDDDERYFVVDFDGTIKTFPLNKISNFVLSYAMTIHKSQGSEYDIVVMPLTGQNYVMLQRNLLYTGLTRAKKVFVLFGTQNAIQIAVRTLKVINRNTHLDTLIQEELERAAA